MGICDVVREVATKKNISRFYHIYDKLKYSAQQIFRYTLIYSEDIIKYFPVK